MSRFCKLSHTRWHCQYHIVWTPTYRFRILSGQASEEASRCIRAFCDHLKCEVVELNVQIDHVHLIVMGPSKLSVSDVVGTIKGRSTIRVFNQCRHLKQKPYWGNYFRCRGYGVDTIGLDAEKIRLYVKYQEKCERQAEQGRATLSLSQLWQQQGKRHEARELLAPMYHQFTEGFATVDLQQVKRCLAEIDD